MPWSSAPSTLSTSSPHRRVKLPGPDSGGLRGGLLSDSPQVPEVSCGRAVATSRPLPHSELTPQSPHLLIPQRRHRKGPYSWPIWALASLYEEWSCGRAPSPNPYLWGMLPGWVTSALPLADQTGPNALTAALSKDLGGRHHRSRHCCVLEASAQAQGRGALWELQSTRWARGPPGRFLPVVATEGLARRHLLGSAGRGHQHRTPGVSGSAGLWCRQYSPRRLHFLAMGPLSARLLIQRGRPKSDRLGKIRSLE